jgi:hypothetical protein
LLAATLSLLLIVGALAPALPSSVEAQSAPGAAGAPLVLRGRIDEIQGWLIYTSVPTAGTGGVGLADGDGLQIQLGGQQFFARFVSPERYARLATDPKAVESVDIDIVCTSDAQGALVVAPLSGDLRATIPLAAGTPIVVVRP